MEIKSGKMVKNLEVCLLKKKTSALEVKFFPFGEIFFNLTLKFGMHHKKSSVFVLFKVSIGHLYDNLESGKRGYCFRKNLEKVLNFGYKNLY